MVAHGCDEGASRREDVVMYGMADFILARIEAGASSKRQVALQAGISRSRMGEILHRCREKRSPMRLDEVEAVLEAIGAGQIEAMIGAELMASSPGPDTDVRGVSAIASMLSELLVGLPGQVAEMVEHIEGLEFDDVRREHGRLVRSLVLRTLRTEYAGLVQRREFRLAAFDG